GVAPHGGPQIITLAAQQQLEHMRIEFVAVVGDPATDDGALVSISLPNNEQVFDDKSCGERWQEDSFSQL
ncbi:MAG TPA: hypothetical protein VG167_01420, partial [Verrucomicrobiae bacterium]|nr:hypothetical protein [Verrucomicrobiae bacterium]